MSRALERRLERRVRALDQLGENMTFDEWADEYKLDEEYPTRTGRLIDCRSAWDAAISECAKLCHEKYERHAANGFPREASTARALADEMRKRSNAK